MPRRRPTRCASRLRLSVAPLRTIFLGTTAFAATVLEQLGGGPHRPVLVITRPDRPRGRGRRLGAPPVADAARELGLALAQPDRVNDPAVLATIAQAAGGRAEGGGPADDPGTVGAGGEGERGAGPAGGSGVGRPVGTPRLGAAEGTVLVVCAFGALIREPLLSAYTPLNVHPSLLPRWRGAAPVERAIMAGDERTGVSIMRLTAGLDSGPVCSAGSEPIAPGDTYGTLAPRLARLGGELLADVLDAFACGAPPPFVEQDEALATYAEKIAPADRLLDPQRPAVELERVVRALYPHIGARLAVGPGEPLGVRRAHVWDDAGAPPAGELAARDGRLLYGTRDGALELLEVQPPGGRPMDAAAYLRGHGPPRA